MYYTKEDVIKALNLHNTSFDYALPQSIVNEANRLDIDIRCSHVSDYSTGSFKLKDINALYVERFNPKIIQSLIYMAKDNPNFKEYMKILNLEDMAE